MKSLLSIPFYLFALSIYVLALFFLGLVCFVFDLNYDLEATEAQAHRRRNSSKKLRLESLGRLSRPREAL